MTEPYVIESSDHQEKEEEALEEIKEKVEEIKEAVEEVAESSGGDNDDFADKVADKVFDRIKKYTETLMESATAAAESLESAVPVAPAAPVTNEEPPEDVKPQRRHGLFRQPMKKRDE